MKNRSWLALVLIVLTLVLSHQGFCGDGEGDADSDAIKDEVEESTQVFKGERNAPSLYGIIGVSRERVNACDERCRTLMIQRAFKAGKRLYGKGGAKENAQDYYDVREVYYILRRERWRVVVDQYMDDLQERNVADQVDGEYMLRFFASFREELEFTEDTKSPVAEIINQRFPAFRAKYEATHPFEREGENLNWGMSWWDARKIDCAKSFQMIGPVTTFIAGGALGAAGVVLTTQALTTDHSHDVTPADELQRKANGPQVAGTYVPGLPQRPKEIPTENQAEEASRQVGKKFKGKITP